MFGSAPSKAWIKRHFFANAGNACLLNEVEADYLRRRPVAPKKGALHSHSTEVLPIPAQEYEEARQGVSSCVSVRMSFDLVVFG
jgi:hypothetical protein